MEGASPKHEHGPAMAPETPETLEKSGAFHTLRLQRDENEMLAAQVADVSSRLQQALREGAERFLEIRRLADARSELERLLVDTHMVWAKRMETVVARKEGRYAIWLSFSLWASWASSVRRTESMSRRMPCRFQGLLLSQCVCGWRRITRKNRRKTWYLVDSTVVHSCTCRMTFDGSIDGRAWKDAAGFRKQLEAEISSALSHLSGRLSFLSPSSSMFKPFLADQMLSRIKVGRISISDFSVEVTYYGSTAVTLAEELTGMVASSRLRGKWTVFAIEHCEIGRTHVGIPRADAKKMRMVLQRLWNDAFASRGRQAAAMKRLRYSSCLVVAGGFRALQHGVKQAKQQEFLAGQILRRHQKQRRRKLFGIWSDTFSHFLRQRRVCGRIILRMKSAHLCAAFSRLVESVSEMKSCRMRLAAAMTRWRTPQMQNAFSCWFDAVRQANNLRWTEQNMAEKRELELANACSEKKHAVALYRLKLQGNRAVVRMMLKNQRVAMYMFRHAIHYQRRLRRILTTTVSRIVRQRFKLFKEAVQRSKEIWDACRRVVLRTQRLFISSAFSGLRCAVAVAQEERAKMVSAVTRLLGNNIPMKNCFVLWQNSVALERVRREEVAQEGKRQRLLHEHEQLKAACMAAADRLKIRARRAIARLMSQHTANAFARFLTATSEHQRLRVAARKMMARLHASCQQRCLQHLLEVTRQERDLRLRKDKSEMRCDEIQPIWLTHGKGIALGVKDRIQRQSQRLLLRARLSYALHWFLNRVECSVDFQQRVRHQLLCSSMIRRIKKWRNVSAYGKHQHRTLERMLRKLSRRRILCCLLCWQDFYEQGTASARRDDELYTASLPHDLSTIDCTDVTSMIKEDSLGSVEGDDEADAEHQNQDELEKQALEDEFMKLHERLEQQSKMFFTRMLHAQLARALDSLKMAVADHKRQRKVCLRAAIRLKRLLLSRAFSSFVDGVYSLKKQRLIAHKVICRLKHSQLCQVFCTLVYNTEKAKQLRHQLNSIVCRFRHSSFCMAIDAWVEYVAEQRQTVEQSGPNGDISFSNRRNDAEIERHFKRATRQSEKKLAAYSFTRLCLFAAVHRRLRLLGQRAQRQTNQGLLRGCFFILRRLSELRMQALRVVWRCKNVFLAKAMDSWCASVQGSKALLCSLSKLRRRFVTQKMKATWRWWVEAVELLLYAAQDGAWEQMDCLRSVIARWRDFVHESRSTRWQVLETALEIAVKERRASDRQIEMIKLAEHHQPMAVALRFEADFEDMRFKEIMSFSAKLQEDICNSIDIPRASVHVLCFKKGSMMSVAEVFLNRIMVHTPPGSGHAWTPKQVADELVSQAADRTSLLRRTVAGSLIHSAEVHGAVASQVCVAVEKSLHLLASRGRPPKARTWLPTLNMKCLGSPYKGAFRSASRRGSHEPQVQPPRALRGSTGSMPSHTFSSAVLPQIEMSSRRSSLVAAGAAHGSTNRHREVHRDMYGYSAVENIGHGGREVVTGHMVFADADQSNHLDTDDDPITYLSTGAGEGDTLYQSGQQQHQPSASLVMRRQTPLSVEEKFFNVSARSIFQQPRRLDDDW